MNVSPHEEDRPIRVGISSCLLGENVRYDGTHKHEAYLTETLGRYFEWVSVCPEVELGLGTPRETIQLVGIQDQVRLRTTETNVDLTDRMSKFAKARVAALAKENLSGFVLKENSPSCGPQRVKVHQPTGAPRRNGVGLFAQALLERFPNLPVEDEGQLRDPKLRENWTGRVFAYQAIQQLWSQRWKLADLIDFHTSYKFVLLAHSEKEHRDLNQLIASAKSIPRAELRARYEAAFMTALKNSPYLAEGQVSP